MFKKNILKDFQKIFHSPSIPDLYLKRLRSWSSAKRSTILLKYKTEISNILTQTGAIFKQKKISIPDWRQIKVLFKGFKMI